jgi:hypothetical protein
MQGVTEALNERFDNMDELKDIARHGCEGGVSGFIYDHELREFFYTHEDEIEWIMDDNAIKYSDLNVSHEHIQDYITKAVWYTVQQYAEQEVYRNECELNEEYALANAY